MDIASDVCFLIWCILDHVQHHLVAKNDDIDRKLSTLLLRYNLFIVLLHTRGLVCKGISILPYGPSLNRVVRTFKIYQENLLQQCPLGARVPKPSQKETKLYSINYKVSTFNVSPIVGLKITTEWWLSVKGPTRFHLSPYKLVCDYFEVLQGQKRVKKGQNRLKLAKTVILSFIYIQEECFDKNF